MKIREAKVYVGCGPDQKKGYVGCDLRKLDSVKVVCKSWELSDHFDKVHEIYSRHMLEHLTFKEVEATLNDWYKCLQVGGCIHLVVPFLDFHIEQWNKAEWNETTYGEKWSDASWSMAGFYGWQRECDPTSENYNSTYWDVHKSGFNIKNITFLLERAGFSKIDISIFDQCHLVAKATRSETLANQNAVAVQSSTNEIKNIIFGNTEQNVDEQTLLFNNAKLNIAPWNLSRRFNGALNSIECKDTLEFMTAMEVNSCLTDWHRALALGGKVILLVPDADYFAKIWLEADWTEAHLQNPDSPARISKSGLYGAQSKGNPKVEDYDPSYSDTVKTPFNERYLSFLMLRTGFEKISIHRPSEDQILLNAVKLMPGT